MKAAVCEDEPLFAERLVAALKDFCAGKGEELSAEVFDSFAGAAAGLGGKEFAIIFMDINLGGSLDGVELCRRLRSRGCDTPIIFVTSLENRAIDGYDVNAFGFILKKQMNEKLQVVMERYWKEYKCLAEIMVQEKGGVTVLPLRDILWAEADGRCTLVHLVGKELPDQRPISKFAAELRGGFTEVFKGIHVNLKQIKSLQADTVTLSDGTVLPLSRRNRKNVMQAVMEHMANVHG